MVLVITSSDRLAFKRCRRAWDLGSRLRQNWEPSGASAEFDLTDAVRAALAVWYFPGMWEWDRAIVRPLAVEAWRRMVARWPDGHDDVVAMGRQMLDRYFDSAPEVDIFTPVRVETDFQVTIPDPTDPVRDLAVGDGSAVHFAGRIELLVIDPNSAHWLVAHRVEADWADHDELVLDERGAAFCWAWERFTLGTAIAGVVYNELRTDGSFRRTPVRRDLLELERVRQKLGAEARDMTGAEVAVYPSPSWPVCSGCAYRPPCIALNTGVAADDVLATSYRHRAPEEEQAGRLGGVTWSIGRGAAPPQFGHSPHPGP